MQEALGHEELPAVRGAQLHRHPLAIGRRSLPHIHRHIEDRTARAAHQLVLRTRRALVVQAAQRAPGRGKGMVVLHEGHIDPRPPHPVGIPRLGKPPAVIAETRGSERIDAVKKRLSQQLYYPKPQAILNLNHSDETH